ncbi:MAG: hypothetical protein WC588_02750 [Candidatus Micrarchaeia archaeon]
MASNLPSRFSKPESSGFGGYPQSGGAQPPAVPPSFSKPAGSDSSSALLFISILALAVSLASFYGTFFAEKPLTQGQKEAILGVTSELRALQDRDITLSAPVQTTVSLDKQYPIKDLFPETFNMPLSFEIPIDTQLVGLGTTGQPISFMVQENVPIKVSIPISSATAFGNNTIRIKKELPVDARFTSSVKVRAVYGTQINGMIDALEKLAGESPSSN